VSASDRRVRDAFVEMADTLVAEFDIIDFLDTLARRAVDLSGPLARVTKGQSRLLWSTKVGWSVR
jgi:hypothetical protein